MQEILKQVFELMMEVSKEIWNFRQIQKKKLLKHVSEQPSVTSRPNLSILKFDGSQFTGKF